MLFIDTDSIKPTMSVFLHDVPLSDNGSVDIDIFNPFESVSSYVYGDGIDDTSFEELSKESDVMCVTTDESMMDESTGDVLLDSFVTSTQIRPSITKIEVNPIKRIAPWCNFPSCDNLHEAPKRYSAITAANTIVNQADHFQFCSETTESSSDWIKQHLFTIGDYNNALVATVNVLERSFNRTLSNQEIVDKVGTQDVGPCSAKVLTHMVSKKGFALRILWKPKLLPLCHAPQEVTPITDTAIEERINLIFGDTNEHHTYMDIHDAPITQRTGMPLIYFVRRNAHAQVGYFVASPMMPMIDNDIIAQLEADKMVVSVYEMIPFDLLHERIRRHGTQNAEALLHIKSVMGCAIKENEQCDVGFIQNMYDHCYREKHRSGVSILEVHEVDREEYKYVHFGELDISCVSRKRNNKTKGGNVHRNAFTGGKNNNLQQRSRGRPNHYQPNNNKRVRKNTDNQLQSHLPPSTILEMYGCTFHKISPLTVCSISTMNFYSDSRSSNLYEEDFDMVKYQYEYSAINAANTILQHCGEYGICPYNVFPSDWANHLTFTIDDYNNAIYNTIPIVERKFNHNRRLTDYEIIAKVGTIDSYAPCAVSVFTQMVQAKGFALRILWKPKLLLNAPLSSPSGAYLTFKSTTSQQDILMFGDSPERHRYMDIHDFPLCHASGMPLIYFVRKNAQSHVGYFVASPMMDSVDSTIMSLFDYEGMIVSVHEMIPQDVLHERVRMHHTQHGEALLHEPRAIGCKVKSFQEIDRNAHPIYEAYRRDHYNGVDQMVILEKDEAHYEYYCNTDIGVGSIRKKRTISKGEYYRLEKHH